MNSQMFPLLCFFAMLLSRPIVTHAQIYFPGYPSPYGYPHPRPIHDDGTTPPVEVGGYAQFGGAGHEAPPPGAGVVVGAAGLYGVWNRVGWCPGLDVRIQGNAGYLHGALVGPRLAYRPSASSAYRDFHPYFEALFGPNEYPNSATTALGVQLPNHRGVTSAGVVGIEIDASPAVRWRVVEISKEYFTGLSGVQPYTITTGIVVHLP